MGSGGWSGGGVERLFDRLSKVEQQAVRPPGWPVQVLPAGVPGWEDTAMRWLLDLCPPEFRGYSGLRRYPAVLARFTALHIEGMQMASRRGLAEGRTALRDVAEQDVIDKSLATWEVEIARLVGVRRAVSLVEEALRGRRFRERL